MDQVLMRRKKFFRFAIPTVLANLSSFLYTVVDGIFVGRGVGVDALGAVNLALPFTLACTAIGMMVAVGGVAITSIHIGRGDRKKANETFRHSFTAACLLGLLLSLIAVLLAAPVARLCGANDTFIKDTTSYIFYYGMFSFPFLISLNLQGFVRNDGAPAVASAAVLSSAIANIFLDWLFVFPMQMGVKGAAIASGLGQILGVIIMLSYLLRGKGILSFGRFTPNPAIWGEIVMRGLPDMIGQFSTPITTLCMNLMLLQYLGDISVSAFGILSYVLSLSHGLFFGVAEGSQPLFGQSYGSQDTESLKHYYRLSTRCVFILGAAFYLVCVILRTPICTLFNSDATLVQVASKAMPVFCLNYLFASVNMVITSYFYSTKRTAEAVIASVLQSLVFNSLCILCLSYLLGGNIIWWTITVAELLGTIVAVSLVKRSERYGIVYR